MKKQGGEAARRRPETVTEQELADYLRTHPDFFERHLELLATLKVPHPTKPAVSLIERRLSLLQEDNARLGRKLQDLVLVARDNDGLSRRMQSLTLALIEARNLEDLLVAVQSVLRDEFNADFTAIRLAAVPRPKRLQREREFIDSNALAPFVRILASRRPYCGAVTEEQSKVLFADVADRVASAALLPLDGVDWQGMLAVGSESPERFQTGMGAMFLTRMGEQVSVALRSYLRPLPGSA